LSHTIDEVCAIRRVDSDSRDLTEIGDSDGPSGLAYVVHNHLRIEPRYERLNLSAWLAPYSPEVMDRRAHSLSPLRSVAEFLEP